MPTNPLLRAVKWKNEVWIMTPHFFGQYLAACLQAEYEDTEWPHPQEYGVLEVSGIDLELLAHDNARVNDRARLHAAIKKAKEQGNV
jgi:hypothetical protein